MYVRIEPRCQEVMSKEIPRIEKEGGEIRVLAGEAEEGVHSPYHSQTPIMFLDFTVKPSSELHHIIPQSQSQSSWNYFAYVIEGEGVFGSSSSAPIGAHHVAVLGAGDGVSLWNKSPNKCLRVLVIGGEAVKESVAQTGPFVMNTHSQIQDTLDDFRHFKNGFELAKSWKSIH